MKITRRLLGGVLAAALASISFSQVTFAGTAQQLGAESVIETIKKRGVIKIGLDLFVPWSMRDKNGDLVGFEPDVGRKLAADMGVEVEFIPLPSFIFLVQESITITPDLGGVKLEWENVAEKTVYVHLHIVSGSDEEIRILSSNSLTESIFVRGLESVEMTFLTKVEDFDGNITDLEEKATLTPLFEEMIDKSTWTLMSQLSVNGNAWEGETTAFWDDVVDTAETNSDNSYFIIWRDQNGGTLNWPLDIVINLNKNVRVHRLSLIHISEPTRPY